MEQGDVHEVGDGWSFQPISLSQPDEWVATLGTVRHVYWHNWSFVSSVYRERLSQKNAEGAGAPQLWVGRHAHAGWVCACVMGEATWAGAGNLYTPGGISGWAWSEAACLAGEVVWAPLLKAWNQLAIKRGKVCSYWAQHPDCAVISNAVPQERSRNSLYILNCEKGWEAMLAGAVKYRRREWRRWQEAGHTLEFNREPLIDFVARHQADFLSARGARASDIWSEEVLKLWLQDPAIEILGVRAARTDRLEAVLAVGVADGRGDGLILLADPAVPGARKHYVALTVEMVRKLHEAGVRSFNLGGGLAPDDDLVKAKRQWPADERPIVRLAQVHDIDQYHELCALAGVDAQAPGFFPPYLAARRASQ